MATIPEIINTCGGAARIAASIGRSKDAIYKWSSIGIPDRHWSKLIELSGGALDPATIHAANQQARGEAA
jgi:hypothetical protein